MDDVIVFLISILETLEDLHRSEVIHRNIKPGNILFMAKEQKYYLVDFSVAKYIGESMSRLLISLLITSQK